MRSPTRNQLAGLLLIPGVLLVAVSLYVPTRFAVPAEENRLQERGQAAADGLSFPCEVLVWNIYKGDRTEFVEDMRALSADCDLLLLQEYHSSARVDMTLDELASHSFQLGTSFLYCSDQSATGVATGAVACAAGADCLVTTDTEPVSRTPKATLVCRYRIEGSSEELLVINIHAINFTGLTAFQNQLEQVRERLEAHSGPVVFAGDFNTNTAARQTYLREFMARYQLTEMEFAEDTRTTSPVLGIPIDYVFTRGLQASGPFVAGSMDGSDHKALRFRIDGLVE